MAGVVTILGGAKKNMPWSGWSAPSVHERTVMQKRCGKSKCFLGPNKTFPICSPGTCKINKKGVYAAYVRAKEYASPKMHRKSRKGSRKGRGKSHRLTKKRYASIAKKALKLIK